MQTPIKDLKSFVINNHWINRLKKEAFGLILPDGWLGRPYDNQHRVKNISTSNNQITIVFDDIREIHVTNPKTFELTSLNDIRSSIKFFGYDEILFNWITYGEEQTGKKILKKYRANDQEVLEIVGYFPLVPR